MHETLNECAAALITAAIAAIARWIEKRKLRKQGLLKDESTSENGSDQKK